MSQQYDLIVAAGDEVLNSVANCDPIVALEELVWNALDADATLVEINSEFSAIGSLTALSVQDNGCGFEVSAKEAFGAFGTSPKRMRSTTPEGRIQHGREGRGRYKALALGHSATWHSVAKNLDKFVETHVKVSKDSLANLHPSEDFVEVECSTGTRVEILDPSDEASVLFNADVRWELAQRFAPYLLAYPEVQIRVNGDLVDPATAIIQQTHQRITVVANDQEQTAELSCCVWKRLETDGRPSSRIYLCTEEGFAVESIPTYVKRLSVSMTAYVKSPYFNLGATAGYTAMQGMDEAATAFRNSAREALIASIAPGFMSMPSSK